MNTPTKPVEQKARELLTRSAREMAEYLPRAAEEAEENGWMQWGADMREAASIIAALNTDEERIRREAFEEAAKLLDRFVTPFGRAGPQPDAIEGQMQKMAEAIRSLSTPSKGVG